MKTFSEKGFSSVCFWANCASSLYAGDGDALYVAAGALQGIERQPSNHMMVPTRRPGT